jgi:hypothetical protein
MHPYDQNRSAKSILLLQGTTATAPSGSSFYKIQSVGGTTALTFTGLVPSADAICIGTTGPGNLGVYGTATGITGATAVSNANVLIPASAGPIYGNWSQINIETGQAIAYFG